MTATFEWKEYNGAGETESTATGLNFGSVDQANITTPATYPIAAGGNSFEKYIKADFGGSFTSISEIKYFLSAGTIPTGDHFYFDGETTSYTQPVNTTSTVATTNIPTSEPGSANVSIGGNLSGVLNAPGKSDFIVQQVAVNSAQTAGAKTGFTFTCSYFET